VDPVAVAVMDPVPGVTQLFESVTVFVIEMVMFEQGFVLATVKVAEPKHPLELLAVMV